MLLQVCHNFIYFSPLRTLLFTSTHEFCAGIRHLVLLLFIDVNWSLSDFNSVQKVKCDSIFVVVFDNHFENIARFNAFSASVSIPLPCPCKSKRSSPSHPVPPPKKSPFFSPCVFPHNSSVCVFGGC